MVRVVEIARHVEVLNGNVRPQIVTSELVELFAGRHSANVDQIFHSLGQALSVVVMLGLALVAVLEVVVCAGHGWIEDLEALYKVVLWEDGTGRGRDDEESFEVEIDLLREAMQELA